MDSPTLHSVQRCFRAGAQVGFAAMIICNSAFQNQVVAVRNSLNPVRVDFEYTSTTFSD